MTYLCILCFCIKIPKGSHFVNSFICLKILVAWTVWIAWFWHAGKGPWPQDGKETKSYIQKKIPGMSIRFHHNSLLFRSYSRSCENYLVSSKVMCPIDLIPSY